MEFVCINFHLFIIMFTFKFHADKRGGKRGGGGGYSTFHIVLSSYRFSPFSSWVLNFLHEELNIDCSKGNFKTICKIFFFSLSPLSLSEREMIESVEDKSSLHDYITQVHWSEKNGSNVFIEVLTRLRRFVFGLLSSVSVRVHEIVAEPISINVLIIVSLNLFLSEKNHQLLSGKVDRSLWYYGLISPSTHIWFINKAGYTPWLY